MPDKPEDRPALVDPRIIFAAERTLLAWIRTGLSLMGFGFALARFGLYLRELSPTPANNRLHFTVPFGILLVAFGVIANVLASWEHRKTIRRLREGLTVFEPKVSPAWLIAAALAILGVVACLFLIQSQWF